MLHGSKTLLRCISGMCLGLAALWMLLLGLSGFALSNATSLLGLFLASPGLRVSMGGGADLMVEIALMLLVIGILGRAVWRLARGIPQVLLFAALVVLYGFYGAYTLSVHTLV